MQQIIWYSLLVILGFSVLVITHELGHFLMGRALGFTIVEFSLGLGPKLFGIKGKRTEFTLRALPIGGSCRFYGEDQEVQDERCFNAKPAWKRFLVVFAGPLMNILTCVVLCFALLLAFGSSTASNEQYLSVQKVEEDSPAEHAGIEVGDILVAFNGERFQNFEELSEIMNKADLYDNTVTVLRGAAIQTKKEQIGRDTVTQQTAVGGEEVTLSVDKLAIDQKNGDRKLLVNISRLAYVTTDRSYTVFTAAANAFPETWNMGKAVYQTLWGLITGKVSCSEVSGCIGAVDMASETMSNAPTVTSAFYLFFWFMALIAVNLGIFNLLPLPALDGGRLVFIILEMIRRKPVPPEKEGLVHFIGMILLLLLILAVTAKDIINCFRG